MKTNERIAEALYEIICRNNGFRDEMHEKWGKEAKRYMRKITGDRNISLTEDSIFIESHDGMKQLYQIKIRKVENKTPSTIWKMKHYLFTEGFIAPFTELTEEETIEAYFKATEPKFINSTKQQ